MIAAAALQRELAALLRMIQLLSPPFAQHPGLFFKQKDALAGCVAGLIEKIDDGRCAGSLHAFAAPLVDSGIASVHVGGRAIRVERRAKPRGAFGLDRGAREVFR